MCAHPQAEPVILSTGEQVACICLNPDCYQQLPADYITTQRDIAELRACCEHENRIDLIELGTVDWDQICQDCGEIRPRSQWGHPFDEGGGIPRGGTPSKGAVPAQAAADETPIGYLNLEQQYLQYVALAGRITPNPPSGRAD